MNQKTTPFKKPTTIKAAPGAGKPAVPSRPVQASQAHGKPATPTAQAKRVAGQLAGGKSLFSGVEKAKAGFASNWERSGRYVERIDNVKVEANRKNINRVVIEKTVLHPLDVSECPMPHRPGEQVCDIISSDKDAFLSNVKQLVLGLPGVAEEEITEEFLDNEISPDKIGLFSGLIVEMYNQDRTSREGNPYTVRNYVRPVPASELSEMLATVDYGERIKLRFFKDGLLDRMIALEAEELAQAGEAAGDNTDEEQVEEQPAEEAATDGE